MKQLVCMLVGWMCAVAATAKEVEPLDLTLSNYQYPYPVKYIQLQSQRQSLTMGYMDVKPKEANGRSVMLLHGKNFNGAYWQSTIAALVEHGYRVIVPDQIGFGKSTKPITYQYSFQQLAHNTKTLLDQLDVQQTTVVGHSMGGMLAARFSLMFPQSTDQLVLVNPIGLEDYKTLVPYKPRNRSWITKVHASSWRT